MTAFFHSMLCVYIKTFFDDVSFCVLVQEVKCILYLLLSAVTYVNEAVKFKYLFRVIQRVMRKHLIELGEKNPGLIELDTNFYY